MRRPPVRRVIPIGIAVAGLMALPTTVSAAPLTPEREAHRSRYAIAEAVVEARGEHSASGRFQLDAQMEVRIDDDTGPISGRFGASAKLVSVRCAA